MANRSARKALCVLCAARAATVHAAAGATGVGGTGACAGPASQSETDSGAALVQVKSQVRSQARLDAEQRRLGAPAAPGAAQPGRETAAAHVPPRMQYWNRWDPLRLAEDGTGGKGPERFLLFDLDIGGLNNLRIGWEVAATIAHETGRTLVLPPPKSVYHIDYGPEYAKSPPPPHVSRVEDFLNMAQLRKGGLRVVTVKEFADEQAGDNVTEARALAFWNSTAKSTARRVHGDLTEICDLSSWVAEDKFVYAELLSAADGRLFSCSEWARLGTVQLTQGDDVWTPSPQAMSVLHGGFVWHPDVFEIASLIVQDFGLFEYASLHARYGDFQFQFRNEVEPASEIVDNWFLSELGRRVMRNTTGVYVSTDDTTGAVIEAFRRNGIRANSSADYFDAPDSPIAKLTSQLGVVRVQQLRGPVEQVVCAFGRVFIGTGLSTFTGYINQMRYNADSPQTKLLFHSDGLTESTVAQVESAAAEWEARGGKDHWAEPPQDPSALELQEEARSLEALLQRQPVLLGVG